MSIFDLHSFLMHLETFLGGGTNLESQSLCFTVSEYLYFYRHAAGLYQRYRDNIDKTSQLIFIF